MLETFFTEGLHPMEGTHPGAACEELQPLGKTRAGEVYGGLCSVGGCPCWSSARSALWLQHLAFIGVAKPTLAGSAANFHLLGRQHCGAGSMGA